MVTANNGLLVILALLPTYLVRFTLFGVPLNLLDLLVVGAFTYTCITHHGVRTSRIYKILAGSFLLVGCIAVLVSDHTLDALGIFKSYMVVPILLGSLIQTLKPKFEVLITALGMSVLFVSAVAIIQWLTGYGVPAPWNIWGNDLRMTSIYEYPNAVGLFCAPIVALAAGWLIHERTNKLLFTSIAGFGLLAIGLSQSAGAVIAVGGAITFSFLFTKYRSVTILIAGLSIVLLLLIPTTREVVLLQDTSGEVRLALWEGTWNLLKDRPWFGAGLGNFPAVYEQYKLARHTELLLYPHNILLDFWVEYGIFGLIWLLATLAYCFYIGWKKRLHHHSVVVMSGLVAMLVYGLVDVPYFKNDLAVLFWIFIAWLTIAQQRKK